MLKIAIVEDDPAEMKTEREILDRFFTENRQPVAISQFPDGYDIAERYTGEFDMILLDIEMKLMDGMEAARIIRESDPKVVILFITANPGYAIQGYSVQALDYLLKPVTYESLSYVIKKALQVLERGREGLFFTVSSRDGVIRLRAEDILWIESSAGHRLTVHTQQRDYETTALNLRQAEEKLADCGFSRCNNGCLVNLERVTGIGGGTVTIGEHELTVSRGRKSEFMAALADYLV